MKDYGLDLHCQMILEDYASNLDLYIKLSSIVQKTIKSALRSNTIFVTGVEGRVKTEQSMAGKLELKGAKYHSIEDITDIVGVRVITFYSEDVDKISAIIEKCFNIDWDNSVDKRKMHSLDSFGYMSLHYICRLPKESLTHDEDSRLTDIPFELQMRTALQHVWANMYHDTGYKSGVDVPKELLRNLNRLAGMLELADDEFSRIRTTITDYRRLVKNLVDDGKFDDVQLNTDTFKTYLDLKPFDKINKKIAAINQAEIHNSSMLPYLAILKNLGFQTLGDIDRLITDYGYDAYLLALHEIGGTDIDIISSTVAIQDLCIVWIIENGGSEGDLVKFFNELLGANTYNQQRAKRVMDKAESLSLVKKRIANT